MKLKNTVLLVATTVMFTAFTTNSTMAKTATVNTDTLNLRKDASTSSTVLELLDIGDKLEVIEEDGEWIKVKAKGITGYVNKDYIKFNEDISTDEKTNIKTENTVTENPQIESTETAEVSASIEVPETTNEALQKNEQTTSKSEVISNTVPKSLINQEITVIADSQVSILPLINASKISNVNKEEKVTIIDEVNGWCYIQTEQISGWVRKTVLDINIEEQTVTASTEPVNTEESNNTDNTISNYEQSSTNTNEQVTNTSTTETEKSIDETPIEEKTMYVNYSSVYIRKGPGTNYEVEDSLLLNDDVTVIAESGDWYKVKAESVTGYVAKRLLSNTMQSTSRNAEERFIKLEDDETSTEEESTQKTATDSSVGQEIANFAEQYLGCKYVYGGSGPSTFDCSGFTMYVYKNFGVNLSHSATAQSKNGSYVAKEDLQPGDLVFFKDYETMNGIGHVGIYIGEGNFIHASSGTGYCVKISTLLTGSYKTRYETARRIF